MPRQLLILLCVLVSAPALGSDREYGEQRPLVQVNVSFEMDAINESLSATSESISDISDSFRVIAEGGQLDPEQQQHLVQIMENLDHLVDATRTSTDALPSLVNRTRDTLVAQGTEFLGDLKFWSITILIILCVALVIAIICFYYFVLRPMQRTLLEVTGNISNMAKAMENTSKSLEISNQTQRELLQLGATIGKSS